MPDDIALEASGARIGHIEYRVVDVFDLSEPAEDRALYRLANRLHMETRAAAIEAQLLFRPGDPYSQHALEESARLLRNMPYLFDADIRPIRFYDNVVDVEVVTRDVWTLNPGISFKSSGGARSSSFQLEDANLFGRGKQLQFARNSNVDRSEWLLGWDDPNLWASRWQLRLGLSQSNDGTREDVRIEQPFYALDTRRELGVDVRHWDRTEARYALGVVAERFQQDERRLDLFSGWSAGLHDGWARRWLAGYHYERNDFARPAAPLAATELPPDRRLSYPWAGVEWLQDDFRATSNLDQIGRVEDLAFGFGARLKLGWSSESLGATRDSVIADASVAEGFELRRDHYLFLSARYGARFEAGSVADALGSLSTRYYIRTGSHSVFFASSDVRAGRNLDPEVEMLLGGDSGLRGYPLRYQSGSGRALLTVEQRLYTDWYPFRLMRVGGAVFFDAGRTWGRAPVAVENLGWLRDVGVGLRLGMTRSGLGNVLHVNVAFPLDGASAPHSLQFQIETKRSY